MLRKSFPCYVMYILRPRLLWGADVQSEGSAWEKGKSKWNKNSGHILDFRPANLTHAQTASLSLKIVPPPPRPSPLHTLAANESEDEDTKRGLKAEQHRQSRLQSTLWRVSLLFDFSVESSRSIPRGLKKLCGVRVGWGGICKLRNYWFCSAKL